MMRQYELVERVLQLRSQGGRGAAQPRLRLCHEGARQPEARLGRSLFLPSPRSRRHPHRPEARRRDDRHGAAARRHRGHADHHGRRSTSCSGPEIGKLVDGLTKIRRLDLVSKKAEQAENFRKLLVAISSDIRVLLVKLADRAAQHAHARAHEAREPRSASPRKRSTSMRRSPARMGMEAMREELEDHAFRWLHPGRLRGGDGKARRAAQVATRASSRKSARRSTRKLPRSASTPRSRAARRSPMPSGARWPTSRSASSSSPTSTPSASSSTRSTTATACSASRTRPGGTVPGRFKDYISTPKQNNYQSIHTTVVGPRHQRVELQIRTRVMHDIAEYGVAAHALYKDRSIGLNGHGRACQDAGRVRQGRRALCLAAAAGRDAARRLKPGGVPRAHQARAVPGPGLLLLAEGAAHRVAARRDAARFRLCRAHRHRQRRRRRLRQRPARADRHAAAQRR